MNSTSNIEQRKKDTKNKEFDSIYMELKNRQSQMTAFSNTGDKFLKKKERKNKIITIKVTIVALSGERDSKAKGAHPGGVSVLFIRFWFFI